MLTPNDVRNLNVLFNNREDVDVLVELAKTDDTLGDKLDELAGGLDTVMDLVDDIHGYIHELKTENNKTAKSTIENNFPATYYDNRTPWGFAANRGGNACPACYGAYMGGCMTCPECHRTL